MPFLIAFTLSSMMEPLIRVPGQETAHQEENICADNTPLLLLAIIVTLVVPGILRLIEEIKGLIASAPAFSRHCTEISEPVARGAEYIDWMPVDITDNLGSIIANLSNTVTNFGKTLVKGATSLHCHRLKSSYSP